MKPNGIRAHSCALKPQLTDVGKRKRVEHCLNNVRLDRRLFDSMLVVVHVDEKWFQLIPVNRKFYLAPE